MLISILGSKKYCLKVGSFCKMSSSIKKIFLTQCCLVYTFYKIDLCAYILQ